MSKNTKIMNPIDWFSRTCDFSMGLGCGMFVAGVTIITRNTYERRKHNKKIELSNKRDRLFNDAMRKLTLATPTKEHKLSDPESKIVDLKTIYHACKNNDIDVIYQFVENNTSVSYENEKCIVIYPFHSCKYNDVSINDPCFTKMCVSDVTQLFDIDEFKYKLVVSDILFDSWLSEKQKQLIRQRFPNYLFLDSDSESDSDSNTSEYNQIEVFSIDPLPKSTCEFDTEYDRITSTEFFQATNIIQ